MSFLDKMERKFGRYAIRNISRYFVFAAFIGFALSILDGILYERLGLSIENFLAFDGYKILHGQIWRLVTWIFSSPGGGSVLTILFLLCLIPMGNTLENIIGTFRMNVYIIGGILISDVGGILVYLFGHRIFSTMAAFGFVGIPYLSTYYILLSMFMALAICVPDATVNLYFVLPIKMKWMLIIYFVDLAYELFSYFSNGILIGVIYGSEIVFALINLGLFFLFAKPGRMSFKQKKRQKEFRSQMRQPRPGSGLAKHKCAICGRTEVSNPELLFRYCSKCAGSYEYCEEHLFTHNHVVPGAGGDFHYRS